MEVSALITKFVDKYSPREAEGGKESQDLPRGH